VRLGADGASVAEPVDPDEVAAEALAAMAVGTPTPTASATADAVSTRARGSLICFPLSVSFVRN
jgi:hypothetical protein